MKTSIIITNYNYASYLADAIESALDQTYQSGEVIVVDDGSTDHSRDVIARYDGYVTSIFQDNRGQAAAFNTGFARARGEIVIFLDADDVLDRYTAEGVVETFRREPDLVKVQWRLQWMDARGENLPAFTPPSHVTLPNGRLFPRLLRFPDDIAFSPTSGNAYAARVLEKILPMPEQEFRLCADYYLLHLAPLYGPVRSLPEVGGKYRVHGRNGHFRAGPDLAHVREIIARTQTTQAHLERFADEMGYYDPTRKPIENVSVTWMAHRLVSYRFARAQHPIALDNSFRVAVRGIQSALERPDLAPSRRILWALWFVLVAAAPWSIARRVAAVLYQVPTTANSKLPSGTNQLPARASVYKRGV